MKVDIEREVRAFAPGHVTGIFAPATDARDPRGRGSRGAGIVLELGAHAEVRYRATGPRRIRVTSDTGSPVPISTDVARRLAPARGALTVNLRHDLPVGQGFGMSAAGATATALAVARVSGVSRQDAIATAHLADLFGGGGLGGVAAILGGGLELRRTAGIPPWGEVEHRELAVPVLVAVVGGPLPSPRFLRSDRTLARIRDAATGLDELFEDPGLEAFLAASERFTDRDGLAPRPVARLVSSLRRRGAWAAQAMFGSTVFAVPRSERARPGIVTWLLARGVHGVEVRPARRGAGFGRPQPF